MYRGSLALCPEADTFIVTARGQLGARMDCKSPRWKCCFLRERNGGAKPVSAVTPFSSGEAVRCRDSFRKLVVTEPPRRELVAAERLHFLCFPEHSFKQKIIEEPLKT